MRNMSFSMTTDQLVDGSKDVTRRIGWQNVRPGDRIQAVKKGMGLKKGEKAEKLVVITVVSVRQEPLYRIDKAECVREGFPDMEPEEFVTMFMAANRCEKHTIVTRIEFKRDLPAGWPFQKVM